MNFQFSDKAEKIQEGIFAKLNAKKNELLAQGRKIYNLSVGTPDFKPPKHVMEAVSQAAMIPENYKYALVELPELLESMQAFYKRRFDVDLEIDEIMALYGSQEGMAHIAWSICNPGDLVLVPNPGYPIFAIGPELCDAQTWEYPLYEENGFLPDFDAIPEEIAKKAKMMVVSYPGNPTCKVAPASFYEKLIAFAKKYEIIILHDNAYADLVFGEKEGGSFLTYEGAKEVGVEFYSLSKTFNYTGARASFAIGNKEVIQKFKKIRTQFDYGTFIPVQIGAIAALNGPFEGVREQCKEYEARSKALCGGLREIGWDVADSEGTMFAWAKLPDGFTNSEEFAMELMEKAGVIVVPGTSFGSLGEGYVRMALVLPPEKLREAAMSIKESGILDQTARRLSAAAGEDALLVQEEMKKHTTFRVGGPADYFVAPSTKEGIAAVIRTCREENLPYYIIGNGSNLLVSDEGYRGVMVQLYRNFSQIGRTEDGFEVQAGAMLSVIAKRALEEGLTGFEFASGIPGTIGGAVVMNAGAYGGEMKDVLTEVTVLTKEGEILTVPAEKLDLGYRHSVIPENEWIVLGAKLKLAKGDQENIRARMEELKEQRVSKQPLDLPSAGSTFKRPEGYFAGKLIQDAGLKGYTHGGAQVSEKHAGFVVNTGNATADDVYQLIKEVSLKVQEDAGVKLEPEIKMIGKFE